MYFFWGNLYIYSHYDIIFISYSLSVIKLRTLFNFKILFLIFFNTKNIWNWGIATQQCCGSFRLTGKGLSHTYTCIPSPSKPLPLFRFTKRGLGCFAKRLIQFPFFPCGSNGKEFACIVGDLGLIPRLGRCPGGGHGNPLQYSCLENPHGQRSWRATVHRVTKSQIQLNK